MLELKNVKKSYDGTVVLKNISLDIGEGEIVSILGPSGCGKTTLLNLILGIVDADGGRIIFVLYTMISGRKVSQKVEGTIHLVGLALLFGLMIYVTFNDVTRIFGS